MNTNYYKTREETVAAAGEELNNIILQNIKYPTLLLLSAGSALGILDYVSAKYLTENTTVSVADERFSQDPGINNFLQLQKTEFYARAIDSNVSFFGTLPRPNESLSELNQRWDKNISHWLEKNPKGKILVTLGMGNDGHTAGIFPDTDRERFEQAFNSDKLTHAYDTGPKTSHPLRLTSTFTLIKKASHTIAFVCGQEKALKLKEALTNPRLNLIPAGIFQHLEQCELFTDIEVV